MQNLTTTVQNLLPAGPGKEALLKIARKQDDINQEARRILDKCYTQVGLDLGGDIKKLTCAMDGVRFDEVGFNYDKVPEGQE